MFKNHLQVAFRNMAKRKSLAFINIFGLGISICAFLLILDFISFQKSYDDFHTKGDRIYRLQYDKQSADHLDQSAGIAAGAAPDLKAEYPEIEQFSKLWATNSLVNLIRFDDQSFISEEVFYADEHFFELFDFELLYGDREKVLSEPNAMVVTRSMAQRLFNTTDVVGKVVDFRNGMSAGDTRITGVVEDLPANSHIQFEVLMSFETLISQSGGSAASSYGWNAFPSYLLLSEHADAKALVAKLPEFVESHYQGVIESGIQPSLHLRPLRDIYLHSDVRFEVGPTGNYQMVQVLIVVSIFILGLAYFNYINLTTSLALQRSREIGVRKVAGATKQQLFRQFMTESFVFNSLSLLLGFTLMQFSKPFFQDVMGVAGTDAFFRTELIPVMLSVLVFGTLISGIYPALIMFKINLAQVLKGKSSGSAKTGLLHKSLMVLQFVILCFLLIGSLAVRSQIDYMVHADWGFNSEQVLVVQGPAAGNNISDRFEGFFNQIEAIPGVVSVAHGTNIPGRENTWINNGVRRAGADVTEGRSIHFLGVNEKFFNTLDIGLVEGRDFRVEGNVDSTSVILSRSAIKSLGFNSPEEAIGQNLVGMTPRLTIVGVVDDYMQESFKQNYNPTGYLYAPWANNYFIIRYDSQNPSQLVNQVETEFQSSFQVSIQNYFFLDEFFQRQFEEDQNFAKVFNLFTLLGIWISCLGLIGLTSLSLAQRTKEIGIRKVLGASVFSVVSLFSGKMIWLNVIAVIICIPVSYYAVTSWLSNYTFATSLELYVFVIPVLVLVGLTLITTSVLSIRSSLKNPVKSLRQE